MQLYGFEYFGFTVPSGPWGSLCWYVQLIGTIMPFASNAVSWFSESISFCWVKLGPASFRPCTNMFAAIQPSVLSSVTVRLPFFIHSRKSFASASCGLVLERLELRRDERALEVLRVLPHVLRVVGVRELLHRVHVLLHELLAEDHRLVAVDAREDDLRAVLLDLADVGAEVGLAELQLVVEEHDLRRRVLLEAGLDRRGALLRRVGDAVGEDRDLREVVLLREERASPGVTQLKQIAPIVPKMLVWPAISGLMFQMKVGIGGLVAAMSTKPGPSSALASNSRERLVLGEASS